MSANGLKASEHPLGDVFSREFDFAIPEYQRPYRWGVEQAKQLLDDIEQSLDRDPEGEYFLGSLVLIEHSGAAFDVVDGQQRLTTLTILFAILRDLAEDRQSQEELGNLVFEQGQALRNIKSKPRLALRRDVMQFFTKYVQEPGRIRDLVAVSDAVTQLEPEMSIRDNAAALLVELDKMSEQRRRALSTFLLTKTYLVTVITANLSSAHRIFSVMNSRGLDLSPADIFKSQVIGELDSHYALKWDEAEELLGADDFTELFRDIRTVENGQRARRELLQEFPEQVLNAYLDRGAAADFVDEVLEPYAQAFSRTIAQDFGPGNEWAEVNMWLRCFSRLDNKDWRPAAIWAMKSFPDDAQFLGAFFARLERLAASMLVRGVYTTPRIQRYLDLLAELKAGDGVEAPSLDLSEEETRETRAAIDGEVYKMQARRARYVLLRLDELLKTDGGVEYESRLIQIEHVLPRTPTDKYWLDRFPDPEVRDFWTHRIGNLLLLNGRTNRKAQNFAFPRKRDEYFSKGSAIFQLSAQVITTDDWTLDVVKERQARLVGILAKAWGL